MPRLTCARLVSCLVAITVATYGLAWNATGHMIVADIALRNLTPKAKAEAERLAKLNAPERSPEFISASAWADDVRSDRRETGTWHYIDFYFRSDGKSTDLQPDKENVVWAIDKFSKVLADKSASDGDRAEALRFIIHFVGDIHQPLHCSSRVTDAQPKGDAGGNRFYVEDPKTVEEGGRPRNLHSLWDSGCGVFTQIRRPLTPEGQTQLDKLADTCLATLSDDDKADAKTVSDPMQWAQTGLKLAQTVVYATPENTKPSDDYIKTGQTLSEKRVAEAGLRLAYLLNRLLDPSS